MPYMNNNPSARVAAKSPVLGMYIVDKDDLFPQGFTDVHGAYASLGQTFHDYDMLTESAPFDEVDDYYNPGVEDISRDFILEAIVVDKFSGTEKRMAAVVRVLNRHLKESSIAALPPIVGKPRKSGTFAYVTVQLPFDDGQTVSVIFHSPEGDKRKIVSSDTIIAFQWLLNRRDITHVVAPEDGAEVSLETIAKRVTQLVVKNSARFQATQKDAAEERKKLDDARQAVTDAEARQTELMDRIVELDKEATSVDAKLSNTLALWERQKGINAELQAKLDGLKASLERGEAAKGGKQEKQSAPEKQEELNNTLRKASDFLANDNSPFASFMCGYNGDGQSSNYAENSKQRDAWVLGQYFRENNLSRPSGIEKSEGNTWRTGNPVGIEITVFSVVGSKVSKVSGEPVKKGKWSLSLMSDMYSHQKELKEKGIAFPTTEEFMRDVNAGRRKGFSTQEMAKQLESHMSQLELLRGGNISARSITGKGSRKEYAEAYLLRSIGDSLVSAKNDDVLGCSTNQRNYSSLLYSLLQGDKDEALTDEQVRQAKEDDDKKELEALQKAKELEAKANSLKKYTVGSSHGMKSPYEVKFTIQAGYDKEIVDLSERTTPQEKYDYLVNRAKYEGVKQAEIQRRALLDLLAAQKRGVTFGYFEISPRKGYSLVTLTIDLQGTATLMSTPEGQNDGKPAFVKTLNDIIAGSYGDDTGTVGDMLDKAAEEAEKAGVFDEYEALFDKAANHLTELLRKRAA